MSTPTQPNPPPANVLTTLRARGFVQQISDEAGLGERLGVGRVTFYCGFDPTAASLHVGSLVPLMAMAWLTRGGHRPIAVLGGGTTMVGDPSGKTELRPMLTQESIQQNRARIEPQVRRFVADSPDAVVIDNAEWLLPLNYLEFLRDVGRHFSVNRMLAAEAYKLRLEKGLSFIEFNYQLLQAYDFLVLRDRYGCGLQIGGDDQWGNVVAGIDLIRRMRQTETFGLTFPLLTTASGAKMGKTAAGAVWLDPALTSPFELFQYFVNVDDRDVVRFLKLLTFEPLETIAAFEAAEGAALRDAKRLLARSVTRVVHGEEAAEQADAAARAAFGGGGRPGDDGAGNGAHASLPTVAITSERLAEAPGYKIVDLLAESGLAPSKSAARRLVEQGGVRVGDRKITTIDDVLTPQDVPEAGTLLHAGKKHVRRLVRASQSPGTVNS
jgi:tyrosyl-tRNA synthetase